MWRAYQDLKESNWIKGDKYFHARGNYEAAQRGPGGVWAAEVIRWERVFKRSNSSKDLWSMPIRLRETPDDHFKIIVLLLWGDVMHSCAELFKCKVLNCSFMLRTRICGMILQLSLMVMQTLDIMDQYKDNYNLNWWCGFLLWHLYKSHPPCAKS